MADLTIGQPSPAGIIARYGREIAQLAVQAQAAGGFTQLVNLIQQFITAASGAYSAENARDDVGAALVAGTVAAGGLGVTLDDANDKISLAIVNGRLQSLMGLNFTAAAVPYLTGANVFELLTLDNDATLAGNSAIRLATQLAVKSYVDAKVAGLAWKAAVRAATTVATPLANVVPGFVMDGVTLAAGDDFLDKDNATQALRGIYTVQASGAPVRRADADTIAELVNATTYVAEGTAVAAGGNLDTQWTCTVNKGATLGTTALPWVRTGAGGVLVGANNLSDLADVVAARLNLGLVLASVADFRSAVAGRVVTTDVFWSAQGYVALADAATVAIDLSTGINFGLTMTAAVGGTRALANPTNGKPGQRGTIRVVQPNTASVAYAVTFGTQYRTQDATASFPGTNPGALAVTTFHYEVTAAGEFTLTGGKPAAAAATTPAMTVAYKPGAYYLSHPESPQPGTVYPTAGYWNFIPLVINAPAKIDALGMAFQNSPPTNAQFAIYASAYTAANGGVPGARLGQTAVGAMTATDGGNYFQLLTAVLTLAQGVYWLGYWADNAPSTYGYSSNSQTPFRWSFFPTNRPINTFQPQRAGDDIGSSWLYSAYSTAGSLPADLSGIAPTKSPSGPVITFRASA